MVRNINGKISIRVVGDNTKEEAHWKPLTDDVEFPRFLLEELCGGQYINFKINTTSCFYKVMEAYRGRGQWESKDGNFIFGCNNVDGVATDLFVSGRITLEMREKLKNLDSHGSKVIFYFIDVINHNIAFVYQFDGCTYADGAVGKVASILVEGYTDLRKYNK